MYLRKFLPKAPHSPNRCSVALTDDDPKPDAIGINVVRNTEDNKSVIYDLNGVRQSEPKKGINIINGKKVVVK